MRRDSIPRQQNNERAIPRNQRNTHDKHLEPDAVKGGHPTVWSQSEKKEGPDRPALDLGQRADNAIHPKAGCEESADLS